MKVSSQVLDSQPKRLIPLWFLGAALGGLIFCILTWGSQLPFLADDYYNLYLGLTHPDLGPTDFYTYSRMPVATALGVLSIRLNVWNMIPKLWVIAFFCLHALAFSMLLFSVLKFALDGDGSKADSRKWSLWGFLLACLIFTFNPNNYEIHLWPFLSMHSMGALGVALAFSLFRPGLRVSFRLSWWSFLSFGLAVFGLTLAFLTYETFLLLAFGWIGLGLLVPTQSEVPIRARVIRAFRISIPVVVSITIAAAVKLLLGRQMGFLQTPVMFESWEEILLQFKTVVKTMGLIHFYKANWPLSLLEWVAIGALGVFALRQKTVSKGRLILLLFLPILSALPLSLMTYSAQRAFYGPQLLKSLTLASLFYLTWIGHSPGGISRESKVGLIACSFLFLLTYQVQLGMILSNKRDNSKILQQEGDQLKSLMQSCKEPCQIKVPAPGKGITKDYILPEFVWTYYYERLHLLWFPKKQISFEILKS